MGSNNNTGEIDRPALEKQWAANEARLKLGREDKALWDAAHYTVRPYVYYNKVLLVWSIINGRPQVKEVLKVVSIDASFQDGIWLRLRAEIAKKEIQINHTPRRLLPGLDVIGWVPFFNEMRFVGGPDWNDVNARRNLRLHACFKMRSRGDEHRPVEGHDYLTELHVFRDQFPQYADTRF